VAADRVDARLAGTGHALVCVVEKYHLLGADAEACADKGLDPGIGLAHPGPVRVDDLVDESSNP
jgi:hypothetical protein